MPDWPDFLSFDLVRRIIHWFAAFYRHDDLPVRHRRPFLNLPTGATGESGELRHWLLISCRWGAGFWQPSRKRRGFPIAGASERAASDAFECGTTDRGSIRFRRARLSARREPDLVLASSGERGIR